MTVSPLSYICSTILKRIVYKIIQRFVFNLDIQHYLLLHYLLQVFSLVFQVLQKLKVMHGVYFIFIKDLSLKVQKILACGKRFFS